MPVEDSVLGGVKRTVLVLSGKGGVGKSTTAVQLALALRSRGLRVGLLDIDLCGPSIPRMLGLESHSVHQCDAGWVPVYTDASMSLGVMSIGFLLNNRDESVVWRGPKKNAMIKQFLSDVVWEELDMLLIDTPPGTSDEHITIMEALRASDTHVEGAVLVTTPQNLAVADVRREFTFCRKTGLRVLGVIENMSGYVCPHCSECTNIFSSGGGQSLAKHCSVPFLGAVPIDPNLTLAAEQGQDFISKFEHSQVAQVFQDIADKLVQ